MDQVFDLLFEGGFAYQSIIGIFMGLMFLAFGGLVMFLQLYTIKCGKKIKAKIVGVRADERGISAKGKVSATVFYPIYEFRNRAGETVQYASNDATNSLFNVLPGKFKGVYLLPGDDKSVYTPMLWLYIFAIVFIGCGIGLLINFSLMFHWNAGSALVSSVFFLWLTFKLLKAYRKAKKAGVLEKFQEMRKSGQPWIKISNVESKGGSGQAVKRELDASEIKLFLQREKKNCRISALIAFICMLACLGGGYYIGTRTLFYVTQGVHAAGQIVEIEAHHDSSGDSPGYTYYSIFEFQDQHERSQRVKDVLGSNPPNHQVGDQIAVLYDAADPQNAIIDRGIWNWIPAAVLCIFAFFCFWGSVSSLHKAFRSPYPSRV